MKKEIITKKNNITNDYLKKIKENDKLFEEKMISLNKKKIKSNVSKKKNTKKAKPPLVLSTRKEVQLHFKNKKNKTKTNYILTNEHQMTIIDKKKAINIKDKNKDLIIDNIISFNFIHKYLNKYSEEEQDVLFISKIRKLQKDIKYKNDLIIDLQNKIKEKEEKFYLNKKMAVDELNSQIEAITQDNEEKIRRIKELETETYNQKVIIENLQIKVNEMKNNTQLKEEIENLNIMVEKYKYEAGLYGEKINYLEAANKSSMKDYELLKVEYNKIKNEKEKLEKLIDDQKIKMENYRKHINTLRKFICDEDESTKIDIKIKNNIINKNNEDIINNDNIFERENNNELKEEKKEEQNEEQKQENKEESKENNINEMDVTNNEQEQVKEKEQEQDNDYLQNGINKEKNIYNINKNLDNDNGNKNDKNDSQEVITPYQFTNKNHIKTKSGSIDKIKDDILQVNQSYDINSDNRKNKNINKNREATSVSLRKRRGRTIDDENDEDCNNLYYNTFNDFNEIKKVSNTSNNQVKKKEKGNISLNDITYFPSEKHLEAKKDEIKDLESQLDVLYKEKNTLESEIIKLPGHPKTLKEIKIKKALNNQLSINENNINNIRKKIRKIKGF